MDDCTGKGSGGRGTRDGTGASARCDGACRPAGRAAAGCGIAPAEAGQGLGEEPHDPAATDGGGAMGDRAVRCDDGTGTWTGPDHDRTSACTTAGCDGAPARPGCAGLELGTRGEG